MIQSFHRSHAKKPESGLFSDWIENNTDDFCSSDWPKWCYPLVVVDFSLHFCLHNKHAVNTRVSSLWNFCQLSFLEFEECLNRNFSHWNIFHLIINYTKKLQSKIHRSLECNLTAGTSYRSNKQIHFSNNQFMNWILTWFGCNSSLSNLRIILSDLRFCNTF